MLSRKILRLKLYSKSKGEYSNNNYNNLTKHRFNLASLVSKYLLPGIPVLSIFALVGIISLGVMLPSNNLTRLFGIDKLLNIDKLFGLDSLLEDSNKAYAEEGITPLATSETIGDSTASITISGAGSNEVVSAGRESTVYRTHSISMAGSNVRNYTLSIYGDSNLKYVGSGSGTSDGSSNDILTSAGGVTGKTMNDSTTYDNTWGYGYGDSTTSNDGLTYKAPTGSTIGTAETLASGTIASSANGVLSINNKKLVFAAKFGEDKPSGNYRANVNLALTITPRVLTTYSITYNGNGNTSGTVPAKQEASVYDTASYTFTAAANTGNLTKTGYNFLGWAESSSATAATYTAGSSTVNLTSSKPEITLYAVWEKQPITLKDITKMQEMTADICKASAIGDTSTLTDTRDNSTYAVKKLNSEQCWMTQSLRIVGKTVSSANSDMSSGIFTVPTSAGNWSSSNTVSGVYYQNDATKGAYYTWCAATAGTCSSATSEGVNAMASICPKGWHLPVGGIGVTGTNTGAASDTKNDFMILAGKTSTSIFTDTSLISGMSITLGGATWPITGVYNGSFFVNTSSHIYYWSRTAHNDAHAYGFVASSNTGNFDLASTVNSNYSGYSIRCVAYSS